MSNLSLAILCPERGQGKEMIQVHMNTRFLVCPCLPICTSSAKHSVLYCISLASASHFLHVKLKQGPQNMETRD